MLGVFLLLADKEHKCLACFYGESLYGYDAYKIPNTGGEFGLPEDRGIYPSTNLLRYMRKSSTCTRCLICSVTFANEMLKIVPDLSRKTVYIIRALVLNWKFPLSTVAPILLFISTYDVVIRL